MSSHICRFVDWFEKEKEKEKEKESFFLLW